MLYTSNRKTRLNATPVVNNMCLYCQLSPDEQSLVNHLRKEQGNTPIPLPQCDKDMKDEYKQPNGSVLVNDYFNHPRDDSLTVNYVEFPSLI